MRDRVDQFIRILNCLRRDHPLEHEVRVRREKLLGGLCGDCRMMESGYIRLRVSKSLTLREQKDTLIHEWAHAMVWHENEQRSHRTEWAEAYAKLTRWLTCEGEYASDGGCEIGQLPEDSW